jgi:aminopeptidase N
VIVVPARLKQLLTVTSFIAFAFSITAAQSVIDDTDWNAATPAQIHQRMWEAKSKSLINKQYAREMAAQAPEALSQTDFDIKFYDIYIRVNDTTQVLYGKVKTVGAAVLDGVSAIQIDFYSNMVVDSIVAPTGLLAYSRSGNVVTITLDRPYNTGEQFSYVFWYHGHPVEGGFQAFAFGTRSDGQKIISSLSEPYFARTWWPCKDRPDDKADSFKIAIEVDTLFYVGSNGTLDSTVGTSSNTHTFYYTEHYPMTTYLFSVAISPYTVWHDWYYYNAGKDSMLITNAVYPSLYSYSLPRYGITPQAIALLAQSYGQYPFITEKYGHSNFQWNGGMEHQTMTSMVGSSFGFSEPVVVHELSHQWWGDMITCQSWGHIWLNEGFASYSEAVYYLNRDGWSAYHNYMMGMAYPGGGTIYIYDTTNVGIIFGSIVYDKGAWVLHMLRRIVGEQGFAAILQAYYNSPYKFGSATTEDFRDLAEAVTGKDLHAFFQDWIYGTYRPNYVYDWLTEPASGGGYNTYVVVQQMQTSDPQVFHMPVDFSFDYTTGPADTITLNVDARKKLFKFHTPASVTNIQLDPDNWVLKYSSPGAWSMFIVTLDSEIAPAYQYTPYLDTIQIRGGNGNNTWSIIGGALPSGYGVNNSGVISGITADTGTFTFTVKVKANMSAFADSAQFSIHVAPTSVMAGDMTLDGVVDLSDLTFLIDYLFNDGPAPLSKATADVNASCAIDVSDLSYLVDFLFSSGPAPEMGCAI